MKTIELTKGYQAIVDDEDYEKVSQYKWHIAKGKKLYATRSLSKNIRGRKALQNMAAFIIEVPPGFVPDHINANGLDNRKCNLRVATISQNIVSRRRMDRERGYSSRFRGVTLQYGKKWIAAIKVNGKRKHLGVFPCQICAAFSYDMAAIETYGEFAQTNLIRVGQ